MGKKISCVAIARLIERREGSLAPEQMDEETPFAELGLDSFGHATLLFAVEMHFGVQIPTEELGRLNTLRRISEFLSVAGVSAGSEPD